MEIKEYLDYYFNYKDRLVLKRFNRAKDIANILNEDFKVYGIKVKEYAFREDYDNVFQDYELLLIMGNDKEDIVDITIYYATTRIGERIITETSYEML